MLMDGDADRGESSSPIVAKTSGHRRTSVQKCEVVGCLSPRLLLSRCFNGHKVKFQSDVVERKKGKEELIGMIDGKRKEVREKTSLNGDSLTASAPEESGKNKEVSFNLGLGFGLIYLLVSSKNELNKVQNLCKEMETLLQSLKDKQKNGGQDALLPMASSKQNEVMLSPPSNTDDGHVSCKEIFPSSCYLEDHATKRYITRQKSQKKMELLEAELEAELEHLQLQLDTELVFYREQQYAEIIVEDNAPEESLPTSFEETIDPPPQVSHQQHNGVSPRELERRLYEVLEARPQERIKELELALDRAKQKIHEKEREICWWKDTAQLVFQHVPKVTSQL